MLCLLRRKNTNFPVSKCVSQAKQEARSGNLEGSLQLFQQALKIHFSEKLTTKINKLEEALASLAVEEEDDNFVDVCQSGFMLYGEMHDKLFDYQREGVAFLYRLYRDRRKGGILADDMGLGKTIQIIAFLSGMFDAELIRSVLLILPATLLNNWAKEFAKWTPGLRVKVFHGSNKAERNRNLERIQSRKGILITTYQMLLNNWQQLSSFGGKEFVWDYIILDEAHKIKTPSAKTTKSLHAIPSKNRILLTGTPVQNNLNELWALFDFACQGSLLGTMKTFRMEYETPITRARAKDATPGEKALGLKISENLMSIIKPYFLRRTKDELQQKKKLEHPNHLPENQSEDVAPVMPSLPRKNEFIVWVFLAPVQEEIYRNFISLEHIKELLLSTRSPLAELNILKKLCDHPRLLSNRACSQLGLEASNYSEEAVGENEPSELPDMKRSIEHVSDEMLIQESGKLSVLVGLLERLQYEGHRTLVFSLSRKMLDIIERVLTHRGFKLMRIDGTVTQLAEREKRIGMFQKVGGTGLTLTAASRVVIFDPSWNPATDAQAADRAYRIGQKENVIIYRLISCATVEEKIYRRQVFKDSLIRQSTGDEKNPFRYFTMQELKELFILEDTRSSATQLQLQFLHATQRKTDTELDEHIAYLHTLDIFGISDHDLMYTRETAHNDEAENEEAHRYIEHRVKKAQELVQLESQLNDQHIRNIGNLTEGAWLRDRDSSTQPKTKPSKSSPGDTLGPSTSKQTNPTVMESSTPSTKKSPTLPDPVLTPPVFIRPVTTNEVIDLVSDDDNDAVSDMVSLSSKMTSLVVEDMDDEEMFHIISNTEDGLPSEEKEHQFPSFQACDLNPGTTLVSPFQTQSVSVKEDYSPESRAISEVPAKDTDDEQMLSHTTDMDVLHSKNEEYQPTRLQTDDQSESLNVVSSLPLAISSLIKGSVNSESKMISCDPSPEARSELKDVQMKLLQESVAYPEDGMHQTETDMSLNVLHGDPCEINEVDAVAPHQTMVSKMTESSALQMSGTRETAQVKSPDISSLYQVNFNLAFEDSEYGPQIISELDMSLEETANEGFQLKLDSYCSSATESVGKEHRNHRSLQTSNGVECSVVMDDSNGPCDSRDSFGLRKKKHPAIIVSEEEEENDELIDELDEDKPGGICMSTPKTDKPMATICFSPRVKLSGRRSTASRRSLFDVVLEEVEDAAREAGTASNVSNDRSVQHECEEELTQNYTEEMSEELKEEPLGETLDSESGCSHFYDTDSSREESFSENESPLLDVMSQKRQVCFNVIGVWETIQAPYQKRVSSQVIQHSALLATRGMAQN
ncbi:hypothetical protein E2320_012950 [Naja naja]|nr:hypothetical protein E2320_012950 [Naja naja]